MAVTLSMLCGDTEQKYGLELIAGKAGMNALVRWVHTLETEAVQPFLRGGELIVTTGIGHSDTAWLDSFAKALKSSGAAGLAVLVGAHIPEVPESVTSYCEREAFPLFAMRDETKIPDMTCELCRRITGMEKHDSAVGDALRSVMTEPVTLRSHSRFLVREGFSDDSRYSAVAACVISDTGEAVDASAAAESVGVRSAVINMKSRSAVFTSKGILTAVCQNCTAEEVKLLCERIKGAEQGRTFIGVSESVQGLAGISRAYEQAEAAMISSLLSDTGCTLYKNIGIMKLILGVRDRAVLRAYVNETLGKLRAYDSEHDTDLAHVLRVYIENNGSVNEVAAIEKVHRNTVNGKMRMVKELLGDDLGDVRKSGLHIAFLIDDVLRVYDEKLNTLGKA